MKFSNKTIEMCEWLLKRQMRLALPLLPSIRFSIVELLFHSKQKNTQTFLEYKSHSGSEREKTPEINTHSQGWRSRANSLGGSCLHQNGPSFWRGRLKACMHIKRQRRRSSSSSNDPTAHIFYSIHSNVSQRELSIQWQQNIAADDDLSVWCDRRNHW